jgi:plastocyanin
MCSTRLWALAAAAALALAGCGDDEKSDAGSSPGDSSITVSETEFRLDPAKPKVAEPGALEVVAKNDGKVVHALEVEGPGGEAETKEIAPGKSATLKVDLGKAGRYEMYCPVGNHRQRGMAGEIVVAGGAGEEPEDDSGGGTGAY